MNINSYVPIIWIIDDDLICQFASVYKLEQGTTQCDFKCYSSAVEGLKIIEDLLKGNGRLPDVILLDLQMPIMDGREFLEILSKKDSRIENIAVYIISSFFKSFDNVEELEYPFVHGFFTKPLDLNDVEQVFTDLKNERFKK